MVNLCNIDGEIVPEDRASVPVLDRGFLFGDSVYEVMRTRNRVPFAWREHLDRLLESARGIALEKDVDDKSLMTRVRDTIFASGPGEKYVRIVVSRGTGKVPNIDLSHAPGPSRVVILVRELAAVPTTGVRVAIVPRLRNDRRALDPAVKSGNYLNNILGLAEARAVGADDCVFLNRDGFLTEASTSNIHVVRDGVVSTPPLAAGLLRGITRGLILRCAAGQGTMILERDIAAADVHDADEVFLSSTLRDIVPVTHVDGRPLRATAPGPITTSLTSAFARFCARKSAGEDEPALAALLGAAATGD
jgi:branched-chain amino acid aminotransferase